MNSRHINSLAVIVDAEHVIHSAAFHGDIEILRRCASDRKTFMQHVNSRIPPFDATPLRLAVTNNHLEITRFLLNHGAEVDLPDRKAQTPLFIAIKNLNLECATLLLKEGANPNGAPRNLCTPLYICAVSNFLPGAELLIQYGADVNPWIDFYLSSPFRAAACYNHYDIFILMLKEAVRSQDFTCSSKTKKCCPLPLLCTPSIHPHYLKIWFEFSGYNHQCSYQDKLFEINSKDPQYVSRALEINQSFTLKSLCRLSIIHCIIGKGSEAIKDVPLPQKLISFLLFSDF